jgi:hypothetical protein
MSGFGDYIAARRKALKPKKTWLRASKKKMVRRFQISISITWNTSAARRRQLLLEQIGL